MPVRTLQALVTRALAEGLDPLTPSAAIARATRPDQQVVACAIRDLPQRLAEAALAGPVLVMIGQTLQALAQSARADRPAVCATQQA
jgi:siroheme synthase